MNVFWAENFLEHGAHHLRIVVDDDQLRQDRQLEEEDVLQPMIISM